jgi:hypothetical protein
MKGRLFWLASLAVTLALSGGCIAMTTDPALFHQVAQIQGSTVGYHDVSTAEGEGYAQFLDCVHEDGHGAMGIHFVNGDLAGDTVLDPLRPEALLYEPVAGKLRFVGVEYVVFAEAWHAAHDDPPRLMGQPLKFVDAPNRYDLPPFYELHAWVWEQNPSGLFSDWNASVSCSHAQSSALAQ